MGRSLSAPYQGALTPTSIPAEYGGTGASTAAQALVNLDYVPANLIGTPLNPIPLDANGDILASAFPSSFGQQVQIDGVLLMYVNQSLSFFITNLDLNASYTLTAILGTVSRSDNIITYTPGAVAGAGGFTINGRTINVTVSLPVVASPTIVSPVNGATNQLETITLTSSAFIVNGASDTHIASSWQVATDAAFTNIVASVTNSATALLSWITTALPANTLLYVRCCHKGSTLGNSTWGDAVTFTTKHTFIANDEEARMFPTVIGYVSGFSESVSIDSTGTRVVVGCTGDYLWETLQLGAAGAAYVFIRSGSTWTLEAKIKASDAFGNARLGFSVSMSADGSRIAVGNNSMGSTTDKGGCYIFVRSGTTWTQEAKLVGSDIATYADNYALQLSLSKDGTRVAVGASGISSYLGAVYIFVRSGTTWTQETKIPGITASGRFGMTVSIDSTGTRLAIIGANNGTGEVYIYLRTGTTWAQEVKLTSGVGGGGFGGGLSFDNTGTRLAIGLTQYIIGGQYNAGGVLIYLRTGTTWAQESFIVGPGGGVGSVISLNSDGSKLVIGDKSSNDNAGCIYTYTRSGIIWTKIAKLTTSQTSYNNSQFGYSVAICEDGSRIIAGEYRGSYATCGTAYIFA